jgi:DNA-binding NarL/FixJ family response regulator
MMDLPGGPPVTAAIIDDHPMSAEGLEARLVAAGMKVVASARCVESFAPVMTPGSPGLPDVVVCDLRLPGLSLGRAVTYLVRHGCRVLAMSGWASSDLVLETVAQGARGYLPKDDPPERFAEAVADVAAVGYHVSARLAVYLRDDLRCRPLGRDELGRSEREMLKACADGDRGDEIAARTGMSPAGVRDSLERIFAAARQRRHDPRYRPTPREEEVMILVGCTGMTDRRAARQLGGISEDTITAHLAHLKEKYQRTHPDDAEAAFLSPRAVAGQWVRDLGLCP